MNNNCLPVSFYSKPAVIVARELLGMHLIRSLDGQQIEGIILEAEAYQGEEDQACHARSGYTPRTSIMYGTPGRAYVYFTYGMHWMLNCVCDQEGTPAAVLIRAIHLIEGTDFVRMRRPKADPGNWCNGPAKLCQALSIDGHLNGSNLCDPQTGIWIEWGKPFPNESVVISPRVGLGNVPEPWHSMPWRFKGTISADLA